MKLKLDKTIALSAGIDAGNRNMAKHKRKRWSREDYNVATIERNRLFDIIEGRSKGVK